MSTTTQSLVVFTGKWNESEKVYVNTVSGRVLEVFTPTTLTPNPKIKPSLIRSQSEPNLVNYFNQFENLLPADKPTFTKAKSSLAADGRPVRRYFVLNESLGEGGQGRVFKAYTFNPDQTVDWSNPRTLKAYKRGNGISEAVTNALLGETVERIELADKQQHLCILPYHEGETLDTYFQKHPIDSHKLSHADYLQQLRVNLYAATMLIDNLCFLHRKTISRDVVIAHADLKHSNVVIDVDDTLLPTPSGRTPYANTSSNKFINGMAGKEKIKVKIIDFGSAALLKEKTERRYGERRGTPLYMATEAAHANGIGVRTDVFSATPLFLEFLGAHNPLRDKQKALLPNKYRHGSLFNTREEVNIIPTTATTKSFNLEGMLNLDPLGVLPQLSAFISRMEQSDYNQRATSPEVLIFFNSLRLLLETWVIGVECLQQKNPTIDVNDAIQDKKIVRLFDPCHTKNLILYKARLTLLSLDLYKTKMVIKGFTPREHGLIAPTPSQEKLNVFELNPYTASSSMLRFCNALNALYPEHHDVSKNGLIQQVLQGLFQVNLSLNQLTQAIKLIPHLLPHLSAPHSLLTLEKTVSCLKNYKILRKMHQLAWLNQLTPEHMALLYLTYLKPHDRQHEICRLSPKKRGLLLSCLQKNSLKLAPQLVRELNEYCHQQNDLDRFKMIFMQQYRRAFFASIFGSEMECLIRKARLTSLQQVTAYIARKPNSRSSKVFKLISSQATSRQETTAPAYRTSLPA